MSIEKIISKLSEYVCMLDVLRAHYPDTGTSGIANILRAAIEKLRTHPDAQPDEPLTLEELRMMSGLPVWVESPGVDREISGRWVIVDGANPEKNVLFTRGDFTCHYYGTAWLAYRRPPEEV